jgi:dephospho-CoA kinase
MKDNPIVVGLTGGIASGKSTVAGFLRDAGVPVIDADNLGHIALAKGGEAFDLAVKAFGADILGENGEIDRQKLGAKVFDNPDRRAKLEAITHPIIARLSKRGLEMIAERGEPLAIYEAALLVETGVYKGLDSLVVVSCSVAAQMERLVARDGFKPEAAAARIASQYPLEDKLAVADYIIDNDGSLDKTKAQTLNLLEELKKKY